MTRRVWLTTSEAARRLGVTRQTVSRWCLEGLIRCRRVRRGYQVPASAVEAERERISNGAAPLLECSSRRATIAPRSPVPIVSAGAIRENACKACKGRQRLLYFHAWSHRVQSLL